MGFYKVEFTGVQGNVLEGPHWMHDQQKLLFIDYSENKIHIWDPETKQLDEVHFGELHFHRLSLLDHLSEMTL